MSALAGSLDALAPEARLRSVRQVGEVAAVELAGREPDFSATATIVYSLTELPGVEAV